MIAEVTLQTPGGKPAYTGAARIDGVPGTSAPVLLNFLDTAGSVCGSLLPTGQLCDVIDGIRVTCIDNGMPVIIVAAEDMGISGYETKEQLNADTKLAAHIERLRLQAGAMMGIKDLANKSVPKISMVARPQKGGTLCTRTFIPRTCHAAIGVLGAVTVATAAVLMEVLHMIWPTYPVVTSNTFLLSTPQENSAYSSSSVLRVTLNRPH